MIQLELVLVKMLLAEISMLTIILIANMYPPIFRLTIVLVGFVMLLILSLIWSKPSW